MSFRTRPFRPWLWSAALVALSAGPAAAQPPSPLELVRGLREHGHVELATEYLKHLESDATLSPDDKAAIQLERAKCLLEASEDEADEGTRQGMVAEAKEGLNAFVINAPNHPRAVEALLATAKLTSLDAKEQLNRARRMEIPGKGEEGREAQAKKQLAEAARARPLFGLASKRFADASDKLRVRLDDKALDPIVRKTLEREAFEADLASGINQFNIAETYLPDDALTSTEKEDRNKALVAAKDIFNKLAKGPRSNRTAWVAKAWAAEVTFEQDDFNTAAAEVADILKAPMLEAEDGKRLARFFQLRRNYAAALGERSQPKVTASVAELRNWLNSYGNVRKPTPEVFAVRYYLARALQVLAESSVGKMKEPVVLGATAKAQLTESEKLYRALAQADHDFTARAARNRMAVVRRLLGDADQPVTAYDTFEKAQMAALIQMSKLAAEEAKKQPDAKKVDDIRHAAIALLERSRELASPQDNPADVTDVLLRLIYFYHITDQPQRAAVLGEHVAHTIKSTGGKAALAGLLGLNGYVISSTRVKMADPEEAAEARRADRDRAMALARFLDEKYPNDNATDSARYRLGSMLVEEKRFPEAFEALIKVRPSYSDITRVRLLEGYVATQLVNARAEEGKPKPLPQDKKAEVFKRAVADLAKVPKPVNVALEEEVRNYLSARCRLASLLFAQKNADPAAEKANPGYNQAIEIAEAVIAGVPTFDHMLADAATKKLKLDGLEMTMLAQDTLARAVYLRARALIDENKLDDAAKTLEPVLEFVRTNGQLFTPEMNEWAQGAGGGDTPEKVKEAEQKAKIAALAAAVDKTRVDVILAGFRLKVQQGKPAEGAGMLDLMIKAGGTIENNLRVLELLGRELAAKMVARRKEGKGKEADDFKAGLAELLKKIDTVKKLPPESILFVGQTLQNVGENEKALVRLRQVPVPEFAGWETKKREEIPQEVRGRVENQIRDYAIAQLTIAKALRELKKFDEAEKMLQAIIGTNDKPGWGSGRLYFRKELATLYEDKGASIAVVKDANTEWGKGLREWTTLFNMHKARLQNAKDASPDQLKQYRNAFADAYFDVQRCLVKANQQLLNAKDPTQAAKLQKTYEDVGKRFADMEKQIPAADWQPDVQHRYHDLLKEVPQVMTAYKTAGGKAFLEKLPVNP